MTSFEVKKNLFLAIGTIFSAFITVVVNCVAAYYLLIFKKSSFNRKQYNNFLMGLQAVMGICLALTGYTWTAVAHLADEWPAGNVGCSLATFCLLFFGTMTVMITLVMSAERFIALCIPFYYEVLINFRKIVIAVSYITVHAAALATLPIVLDAVELTKQPIAVCLYSLSSRSFKEVVVVHAFICNFSLSILLMLVMNISVLKALKKMNRSVSAEVRAQMGGDRESSILSNLTSLMALSYSFCWIPVLVRNLAQFSPVSRLTSNRMMSKATSFPGSFSKSWERGWSKAKKIVSKMNSYTKSEACWRNWEIFRTIAQSNHYQGPGRGCWVIPYPFNFEEGNP